MGLPKLHSMARGQMTPVPLAQYLDPRPDYWVCAVCFSTQPRTEDCHCRNQPRLEITAYGAKPFEEDRANAN
jgi:hypothetical protein